VSFSSKRKMFGVGVCVQAVPFQCSASICAPSSSFGPGKVPTAQASVVVRAETAFTRPSAGLAIGVIVHPGAAAGAARTSAIAILIMAVPLRAAWPRWSPARRRRCW